MVTITRVFDASRPTGRTSRTSIVGALLVTGLVVAAVLASLIEINPDWFAYQLIFDTEGAWLSEQGRDPAFLLLIDLARWFYGVDGYEQFREALATYFCVFTALLALGRILQPHGSRTAAVVLVMAIANFALARFTVQVREGIAATLLVFGIAAMLNSTHHSNSTLLKPLLAFLGAALIHAGTFIYLPIGMLAAWLAGSTPHRDRWRLVSAMAPVLGVLVPLTMWVAGDAGLLAQNIGERIDNGSELSIDKLALTMVYALISWGAYAELRRSLWIWQPGTIGHSFVRLLGGPVLLCLNLCILTSLLLSEPNAVVSSYSRLLYLCLGLSFLLAGFAGRARWITPVACLLLMADQLRIISDSVAIYFGVSLF